MISRRMFVTMVVLGTAGAALPIPTSTRVVFPRDVRWRLYMIHNRYTDDQLARLLVWTDGEKYEFTASDEKDRLLATDRRWTCLGRLRWVVAASGYYEHHVVP